MIEEIQEIVDSGKVLARIVRSVYSSKDGLKFYSQNNEPVQVGIWAHSVNTVLKPHIHNQYERTSTRTGEVVFVLRGRIHCDIYDDESNLVHELELKAGELLISLAGGHGYRIMEEETRVLEVKNGPYSSPEIDKRLISDKCKLAGG